MEDCKARSPPERPGRNLFEVFGPQQSSDANVSPRTEKKFGLIPQHIPGLSLLRDGKVLVPLPVLNRSVTLAMAGLGCQYIMRPGHLDSVPPGQRRRQIHGKPGE
jgi:hypothetical protein